jgi:hypothetical protein
LPVEIAVAAISFKKKEIRQINRIYEANFAGISGAKFASA